MTFNEDLSVFLNVNEFAVPVTAGSISGLGILDTPSDIIADGVVLTTDYMLTCEASKFGNLTYGAGVTVDGYPYTVRNVSLLDDGSFCQLMLQRTTTPQPAISAPAVLDGDSVDTTSTVVMDGGTPSTIYIDGNVIDAGGA